jgi:hypothetical protein
VLLVLVVVSDVDEVLLEVEGVLDEAERRMRRRSGKFLGSSRMSIGHGDRMRGFRYGRSCQTRVWRGSEEKGEAASMLAGRVAPILYIKNTVDLVLGF